MTAPLLIIAATALLALALGFCARAGKVMDFEQWSVAGRGFGAVFVFLLFAGEIYTTFTFLGASGYVYGKGAPAFYILAYGTLAYVLSYFILPPVWTYAKKKNLYSQPDFFAQKYDSAALGILVAVVDVVALIPYLVLQFKGLGIIVSIASYGAISNLVAVWLGASIVTLYVIASGVYSSAWTSVVKDIAILLVVLFLGITLPLHYYGGIAPMFTAIERARPGFLALPAHGQSVWWFDSTVVLTALGFFMWPHSFAACYTARSPDVIRRNAIFLPLYQLILLFVFLVGFAAIYKEPGLKGPENDLALFRLSVATFPPWVVGLIGGAGLLTALVPGSLIMVTAGTLLANNIYRLFDPFAHDAWVGVMAKVATLAVGFVAVFFALRGGKTIVALLLMGYSFVIQLFPAFLASLAPRNPVTAIGAGAGLVAGVVTVAAITLGHASIGTVFPFLPRPLQEFNVGTIAFAVNVVVLVTVSFFTRTQPEAQAAK